MKRYLHLALSTAAALALICCGKPAEVRYTDYVNPYIGTDFHGHVFLGANVPFGLVQLGPTNRTGGWDWCSGYHYSDSTIIGFGHMHMSGTGIGDLGDVALMPAVGDMELTKDGMTSLFSRDNESVRPGHYRVRLDRFGIDAELTATKRVGFHKYSFPATDDARVVIDLVHGIGWDSPREGFLSWDSDSTVSGYRYSRGWARDQRIYFTAHFSRPIREFLVSEYGGQPYGADTILSPRSFGQAVFDMAEGGDLYVKVALSPTGIEGARANMQAELPGWDFAATVEAADRAWNAELSKVRIEADEATRRVFYTAMYHTMIAPSEFCDTNGDYFAADKTIRKDPGFVTYTTFSLWDTYRAAHPLMTLIHPEKVNDMINTMLDIFWKQEKLPVWHFMGNETDCMVGNPAIPVVADAMLKGFDGFDHRDAYYAMTHSAMLDERGLDQYREYGYIPCDGGVSESVAKSMEYAIADWCIAKVARQRGEREDHVYFQKRSRAYKHFFDPQTRFARGKTADGKFIEPFDPFLSVHEGSVYTEGNAWQYTWLAPHDVRGLVGLFGGREAFVQKLDSLFVVEGELGDKASPDISGLIGQYAHGNEPSHHTIYLYTMIGQPGKTAEKVRRVMREFYTDAPDGLCGNEDVGQMSAWYILSALGMYQVEPAGGKFVFGSPAVDGASISVGDGKTFRIDVQGNSPENIYIQSVSLNGEPYAKNYLHYDDIVAGGTLAIRMGPEPAVWYGEADDAGDDATAEND